MFSQGSRRERTWLPLAFEGLWAYLAAAVAAAGGWGPKAHTAGGSPAAMAVWVPVRGGRPTGKGSASRRVLQGTKSAREAGRS